MNKNYFLLIVNKNTHVDQNTEWKIE